MDTLYVNPPEVLNSAYSGLYTCEVYTRVPSSSVVPDEWPLEVAKASANMTVVALPRDSCDLVACGPRIQGYKTEVSLGDEVALNCTSLGSIPAAKLQFFVNNEAIRGQGWAELRSYVITNEQESPQTESAVLSMRFRVRKHHVHLGRIHVRYDCASVNTHS